TLGERAKKAAGRRLTYRRRYNKQEQYGYAKPANPQTPTQQAHRQEYG
ncbi:unnamed protein product, partial [marine sediment metagenome]